MSFSHDGRRLSWVGHDSSIAVADADMAVSFFLNIFGQSITVSLDTKYFSLKADEA